MSTPTWIMWLIAIATCGVSAVTDLASNRIPNILTLSAAFLALLIHGLFPETSHSAHGWSGVVFSLCGMAAGFVVMLLIAIVSRGGGGDVKLAAALGAMLGTREVISVVGATCLLAVVGSCVLLILSPDARRTDQRLTLPSGDSHNPNEAAGEAPGRSSKVPLGPYFLAAVLFLAFRAMGIT